MPFIVVTNQDDLKVSVNTDLVLYAEPNGERAKLHFSNGNHLRVQESYAEVAAQLPAYTLPKAVESVDGELLQEQPLTEEQDTLIRETLKHQAQLDAEKAAEDARKDKGTPAKTRETKAD